MNEHTTFLSRRLVYGSIGVALVLMVLGSFVDYPLSCALYNETNPFAMLFAAYGEIPATLGWVLAGSLFVCGHNRNNKILGAVQSVGGICLILLGTMMVCFMPTLYLPVSSSVLVVVGLVLSTSTIAIACHMVREADRAAVIRVGLVIFLVILCELLVVNFIKVPWGRPRMRLVANNPEAYFLPWWQFGSTLKNQLTAVGVAAEEFKSFPSGHTANAATMLLLGLIPYLMPQLHRCENAFVAFGFVWTAVVAFTRIVMGAHYLTDTVVGFLVGFLSVCLIYKAVFRLHNREKGERKPLK